MKWLKEKYEKWCKETKRNGKILIGSMYEFFDWLEDKEFNAEANDVMDRMIKESGIEPPSTEVKGQQDFPNFPKQSESFNQYLGRMLNQSQPQEVGQDECVCAHYYDFFAPNDSGNVVCKKCGKTL